MVRDRIYGGMGMIISDEKILEHILDKINPDNNSKITLADFEGVTGICSDYLDGSGTIAVYSQHHLLDGFPIYPEKGLVIWANNDVRLNEFTDEDRERITKECLAKIEEYITKYNSYDVGLILYTEYS
ncbi:MAG: hypothetical protein IJ192_02495 [Clostridia bacterium]|nr:hypothetical protein [Clostridia bacterium]